ncbi:hypothetical protein LINPERPRIM_LOCUS14563 [Linum perenne]
MSVRILEAQGAGLLPPFDHGEVKAAVMDMGPLKAPGKDGFQTIFLKKC